MTTRWDRISRGITGKRAVKKLLFQTPTVLRTYPLVEKTSGDNIEEKSGVKPLSAA